MRLIWGIINGFFASGAWFLKKRLHFGNESWLAGAACRAFLRMYSLGSGIDDGASYLFTSWGQDGLEALRHILSREKLPSHHRFFAEIFVGRDPSI